MAREPLAVPDWLLQPGRRTERGACLGQHRGADRRVVRPWSA